MPKEEEKQGFSIMVGGDGEVVEKLTSVFDDLAQENGWAHFGPAGAGHFVKMIHNGVEYGMMQSYAEGYQLLKESPFGRLDLAKVAKVWQHGSVNQSFLNQLIQEMLEQDAELSDVEGVVAESGEARWTLQYAEEKSIETPAIKAAFDVRLASQQGKTSFATKFLARLRNAFGGHDINPKQ
jgi:6-phosphogluconate dehydrogenase